MCPAIHINSRSWLRSSSTHEPSDPPLRVIILFTDCMHRSSKRTVDQRNGAGLHRYNTDSVDAVRLRCVLVTTLCVNKNKHAHGRPLRRFFEPGRKIPELLPARLESCQDRYPYERTRKQKRVRATVGSLRLRNKAPEHAHQSLDQTASSQVGTSRIVGQPSPNSDVVSCGSPRWSVTVRSVRQLAKAASTSLMILPQVHLRKPCYDFYFL
jgi:hypothetical protein